MNAFELPGKSIKLFYKIGAKHYLKHQLYSASKSKQITQKRKRNRISMSIIYFLASVFFLTQHLHSMSIVFFILSILWFLFYPIYERRRYINHYQAFIDEQYQNRLGLQFSLEIFSDFIFAREAGNESKTQTSDISEIVELSDLLLIRLKSGHSFILPKTELSEYEHVKADLIALADFRGVPFLDQRSWIWK